MTKLSRFKSTRKGGLGALMDLYEEETDFLIQRITESVSQAQYERLVDPNTEDPDCRSIRSICQHLVSSGQYYIEIMKQGEQQNYEVKRHRPELKNVQDFEPAIRAVLQNQAQHFEGRWDLSDEEIAKIEVKTSWGSVMDPESLLEHALVHIMRHHRQILRFIS